MSTATLYKDGAFVVDRFETADDPEIPLPSAGAVLLPAARCIELLSDASQMPADLEVGPLVAPADDVADLEAVLDRLSVIAIVFEKFSDGRGYSSARLLRQRLGYVGELRAVGDVLLDQIPLMRRCGFDAFSISHEPTRRALEAGHDTDVPLYLQPVGRLDEQPAGARAWARRAAVSAP